MPRHRRVSHSEPDAEKQGNTNVTPAIISLDSLERITTTPVHSWKDCAWKYHQPAGLSIDVNMAETGGWGRDGVKHWQALSEFTAVQSWFWDVLLSICTTGSMRVDRDVMRCLYNKHLRTMGNKFCSWLMLKNYGLQWGYWQRVSSIFHKSTYSACVHYSVGSLENLSNQINQIEWEWVGGPDEHGLVLLNKNATWRQNWLINQQRHNVSRFS